MTLQTQLINPGKAPSFSILGPVVQFLAEKFLMDRLDQNGAIHSNHPLRPSPSEHACPECAERSCLRALVADLLYKNQILRLDLQSAHERLMKAALPQRIGDM